MPASSVGLSDVSNSNTCRNTTKIGFADSEDVDDVEIGTYTAADDEYYKDDGDGMYVCGGDISEKGGDEKEELVHDD
jgi:hypothetical protein